MLKDITLGQYYPSASALHALDPRTKLVGTLVFMVSLFIVNSFGYALCTAFLICMIIASRVPFLYMVKGLKAIFVLLVFTAALNLFLTAGEPIWQFGILKISKEGLNTAVSMAVRLVYLVLGASLMTLTTTPNKLTDGLESLLGPLTKIKVPVHEIAMMMSIALRFIPILTEETDRIMKAQMARGADFESGKLMQRIKALIPVLVPMFVAAFRRANDLALAMEARCYRGGAGRTHMKPLKYTQRDIAAYIVMFAYLGVIIFLRVVFGW
ncbi:MAG TPA: energy-coupling factor transporter transmembrane protein EcfT [Candidatus Alectryocaccobium stercorigallinarum]|nr:energy-coupling factor transporter transmembrane protein EcfT [Candidatus Alectryocaccobium stercorigallinarum]